MEQSSPLVSILLPTHNRADVLPFAIQSVLAQTIPDFELLIVGDGCTDNTADVVQRFADSRIRWFDLPKAPGFGYANRNIALKSARGEYIAFMAHDDLWMSDHLELLLPVFKDKNIEIVYSRPLWVIPFGLIVPGTFNLEFTPMLETFLNKKRNEIPAGCVIHRRECFTKYGYWDDSLPGAADWDMWVRIIKGGGEKNFAYVSTPTCLHFKANWHDDSYDAAFEFQLWRRLFATEGLMPESLRIPVTDGTTEQGSIWKVMCADLQEWNRKLHAAIQLVVDVRVSHANKLTEFLLNHYQEVDGSQLVYSPTGIDTSKLIGTLDNIVEITEKTRHLQAELNLIKNSLTWRTHEYITNIRIIRKLYLTLIGFLRRHHADDK